MVNIVLYQLLYVKNVPCGILILTTINVNKIVYFYYQDSQISEQQNGSQDMFDSQESQLQSPATCAGGAENKKLLQTIREFHNKQKHNLQIREFIVSSILYYLYYLTVQELKDIKNILADKGDSRFIVENSLIEVHMYI